MDELIRVPNSAEEIGSLATLMAQAHRDRINFLQEKMGLALRESEAQVSAPGTPDETTRILATPPEELGWFDLNRLMVSDPEAGMEKWQATKQAAREELQSGHRAAGALDWDGSPWTRAQFAVLRESFLEEFQPRNGIERAMIDMLAQTYTAYSFWLERQVMLSTSEGKVAADKMERNGHWEPPRLETSEAIEQAAAMADRFNRLFLRTLRALRDLRRYAPNVMIQNAGQVNIGQQQVNAAQTK